MLLEILKKISFNSTKNDQVWVELVYTCDGGLILFLDFKSSLLSNPYSIRKFWPDCIVGNVLLSSYVNTLVCCGSDGVLCFSEQWWRCLHILLRKHGAHLKRELCLFCLYTPLPYWCTVLIILSSAYANFTCKRLLKHASYIRLTIAR